MRTTLPGVLTILIGLVSGVVAAQQEPPEPFVWRVTVEADTTAPSTITVTNRCRKAHSFQVIPENVPFLEIGENEAKVKGRKEKVVNVRFNTNGMQPGVYEGQVVVSCLTCRREITCNQDRDVLPVALTIPDEPPAQAAPSAGDERTPATPATTTGDDPCKNMAEKCEELRLKAEAAEAEAEAAQDAADAEQQASDKAEQSAKDAEETADNAEEAAKDDPSDYEAKVDDQEYSSADVAYLEVLRAENNAALAAGSITVEQHQKRAKELTAKKAREERLANKEKLKKEAEKARAKADAARKAADAAKAKADAAQKQADAARAKADAAREAYEKCKKKVRDECERHRKQQQADREAKEKADAEAAATAESEKKKKEAEAKAAADTRAHTEYLINNIKQLGLIDSKAMAQVTSIWQWLPDILETPVATLLEQQAGSPIPTDTLKALGGLYGLIGKLLDPCSGLGMSKTTERLQKMTNPRTGRLYTFDEAFKKTNEMCQLMKELKKKLEALKAAGGK